MTLAVNTKTITEVDALILTRDALGVSEFDIFGLAYVAWYGEKPTISRLEKQFDDYLVSTNLPFYVRHYCRQFIEKRPDCVDAAQKQEERSRFAERLVTGLLIVFVIAALSL